MVTKKRTEAVPNPEPEKVDAGLAEAQKAADENEPTALSNSLSMDFDPTGLDAVLPAVERLVYHEALSPEQKVLLLVLVLEGRALTGAELARYTKSTPRSIEWAMRGLVRLKVIEEDWTPVKESRTWVMTYQLTATRVVEGALDEVREVLKK